MALAFPGQTGSKAEITAIDACVESFGNRNLRKQVLQREPATLSKVLTYAIRIEAIDNSGPADGPTTFNHDGHRKERGFMHAAALEGVFDRPAPPDHTRQL